MTLNYRIGCQEKRKVAGRDRSIAGCVDFGETFEEAISMAKEAIEGYIET
jgi:hypothetical protein